MNHSSHPAIGEPESRPESRASATVSPTRRLVWSVRRELWENRSIYIAPLVVAGVALLGFVVSLGHQAWRSRMLPTLAQVQHEKIIFPYSISAMLLVLTAFIVGVFYCLDALHGERRDRSILFWKSLPVSDLTTVLSKAMIPLVVLPLLMFPIIVMVQLIMLALSTIVLQGSGANSETLWAQLGLFKMSIVLLYGLVAMALWYAPIYGWLLLVSAWARRAAFLWAVLPPLAIGIFEKVAFNTSYFAGLVKYRLMGWFSEAFAFRAAADAPADPLAHVTAGNFFSTPGLWAGLVVATVLLGLAVWLRRYREPI
ncbi:MAG TPA: ABC transporter permease [Casimicrobiaceae bacterium]|nr:ABC transporter permease [Casimicrobiaceae bacterium]